MPRRSTSAAVSNAVILEPIEARTLMSVSAKWVQVPISSAALSADPSLSNYKTYDLQVVVGSGDDWAAADLKANLSSGSFYVPSSFNSNYVQKNVWASHPNIEFDTFITAPNFTTPVVLGRSTYPNPQTGDPIFNSTTVDAAWGDFPNTGAGTFTVARLTISNGATGTIQGRFGHTADGTGVTFSAPVPPTGGSTNTASISGTVWKDSDGDGIKDST